MNTMQIAPVSKPSIVKDAMIGLFSAVAIGLLSSITFVAIVMLLSSHAFV